MCDFTKHLHTGPTSVKRTFTVQDELNCFLFLDPPLHHCITSKKVNDLFPSNAPLDNYTVLVKVTARQVEFIMAPSFTHY